MADRAVRKTGEDRDGDIASLCNAGSFWSPRAKADAIRDIESGHHALLKQIPKTVLGTRADEELTENLGEELGSRPGVQQEQPVRAGIVP